jgi:hypothetical protein
LLYSDALGGSREMPLLGYCNEVTNVAEVHASSIPEN